MSFPEIKKVKSINFPRVKQTNINSLPFYYLDGLEQPIIKIEVIYNAGESYSENPLLAILTNRMLTEGTKTYTSKEFYEKLDFIAAEINTTTFFENSSISLVCLNKYFKEAIDLLVECINYPRFDENDFKILKENAYQRFQIELEKVNILARREFFKNLFDDHPYGHILELQHFNNVNVKQLKDFFNRLYVESNAQVYMSGHIDDETISMIKDNFKMNPATPHKETIYPITSNRGKKIYINKNDAVQSAIRIGKVIIPRTHPDFIPLSITIFALGGYFGSRLMKRLREEKGYTYGIYSFVFSHKNTNVMTIFTEVNTETTYEAIKCIYEEIDKLCQEPISELELENIKSYLIGQFLRSLDGPINSIEVFKDLNQSGLDFDFYEKYLNCLLNISPETILQMSQRYFSGDYVEVVVGKLN